MSAGLSVRILQTHDVAGRPAAAEFLVPIPDSQSLELAVATVLAPFELHPTDRAGVYTYRDLSRGSGWLELLGFTPGGLQRAADAVLMVRVERELGRGMAPFRNEDVHVPRTSRSQNPWLRIVFGTVGILLGAWVVLTAVTASELPLAIACWVMGPLLVAAFGWLLVSGIRQVRWWHAARATALRLEGRVPDRLTT
jgi:hypothetical protein